MCSSLCVEFSSRPLPIQKKFTTGLMQVERIKRLSAQVCSLHFHCKLGALAVLAVWCTGCPEILKLVAECKGAASWEVSVIKHEMIQQRRQDTRISICPLVSGLVVLFFTLNLLHA